MKKIAVYIMIMAILLTVCNVHTKSSQAVEKKEKLSGTEIKPLLSEKIDTGILHDGDYVNWGLFADVTENFAPDWYWMSEDGTVEDTIKGSGMKKKWKKYANK